MQPSDGAVTDPNLNRSEHDQNNLAKRVLPLGWNGTSGTKQSLIPTGFFLKPFDTITYTNTSSTIDTYVSSLLGVTQDTVTLQYTDTSKSQISTAVRS